MRRVDTFMEAHTFSTITLHKSRGKINFAFSPGPRPVIRRECARKRATGPGLSYTCHFASPVPTSADITGGIKRLFALMNVVALGHGKIDLFRVMCLSNPPAIRSVASVLYVPRAVIPQYVIHNAHHKSQMSHDALCNYYHANISHDRIRSRYCLTLSIPSLRAQMQSLMHVSQA